MKKRKTSQPYLEGDIPFEVVVHRWLRDLKAACARRGTRLMTDEEMFGSRARDALSQPPQEKPDEPGPSP